MATPVQIAAIFTAMNNFNAVSKQAQDADNLINGYTAEAVTFTALAAQQTTIRNNLVPEIQSKLAALNAAMVAAGL